jgi:hypothetical protein
VYSNLAVHEALLEVDPKEMWHVLTLGLLNMPVSVERFNEQALG